MLFSRSGKNQIVLDFGIKTMSALLTSTIESPSLIFVEAFYEELGKFLRLKRDARGLSHLKLATKIGLTRTSITNMEAGNQRLSLYHAVKLMRLLGITIDDLDGILSKTELVKDIETHEVGIKDILVRSINIANG